jgi:predicted Zn-dependent protease
MDVSDLKQVFHRALPKVDFASIRLHRDASWGLTVRNGVIEPVRTDDDSGYMVTVHHAGGQGYAASSDLSEAGIKKALEKAKAWAELSGTAAVTDFSKVAMPVSRGDFRSPVKESWDTIPLKAKFELLQHASRVLTGPLVVDAVAELNRSLSKRIYLTSHGSEVYQEFDRILPELQVTVAKGQDVITRTFGRMAFVRQQGLEYLADVRFSEAGATVLDEALTLLHAPNCPTGTMDLLLSPDQMVLQIHESIGHPLELDRILGDERNYAGTSFVTLDMFGKYRYGSPLLNVTYDPSRHEQVASFNFDDEGKRAERQYIIKDGILIRPLGAGLSEQRADIDGVANSRADSWRRPAIDRMANLNVEPGEHDLDDMIARTERGVYMKTNCSWSIDDSRNKFQFGCEWAQLIENGKLTSVVKNPNYRGISAEFWRNLSMVGNQSTFEVLGTPNCGKGEPNQAVYVGHASPACLFSQVQVFGGE